MCQQTTHPLCHCVSRHLPRHPLQHSPHRGGRFAAAPVRVMLGGISWEMSADTMTQQMSCLLTQQMSCLQTQQMSCLQTHWLRLGGTRPEMVFGHNLQHMAPFGIPTTGFCMVFQHGTLVFSPPGTIFGTPDPKFGSWLRRGPFSRKKGARKT